MREPTYFVLASLLEGPLHGYGIIKRAAALSNNRVRLATGTLYTALDRLAAEGYVRLVSEAIVNGRARRTYGLTDAGAAALRTEAARMAEAAKVVVGSEHRLGWGPGEPKGATGMSALERRYSRLLAAYPRSYREDRADEMPGTLLGASAPGQLWPSARDTWALLARGLRVRRKG